LSVSSNDIVVACERTGGDRYCWKLGRRGDDNHLSVGVIDGPEETAKGLADLVQQAYLPCYTQSDQDQRYQDVDERELGA